MSLNRITKLIRTFATSSLSNKSVTISSTHIHPSAIIHPTAQIHPTTRIGPYCIVGENVTIAQDCQLQSHSIIESNTTIGSNCQIFSHAVVGSSSQDKKCTGKPTCTTVGSHCTIREFVTINRGTVGNTCIGDRVHLLTSAHVGHDCIVEDDVVISNGSMLAGHVFVGRGAIIGGLVGIQQKIRIGPLAMVGGASAVDRDVLPYSLVMGNRAKLQGVNLIGLKRKGIARNQISLLLAAQRYLYPSIERQSNANSDVNSDANSDSDASITSITSIESSCTISKELKESDDLMFASPLRLPLHTTWKDRRRELTQFIQSIQDEEENEKNENGTVMGEKQGKTMQKNGQTGLVQEMLEFIYT